jgi:hypothetical protein
VKDLVEAAVKYEVVTATKTGHSILGVFKFEEEPILGATLREDDSANNVIVCINKARKRVCLAPRITISDEKPFIEYDWHLAIVFCRRCLEFAEIDIVQKVGYCPICGIIADDQQCMDRDRTILQFNQFVHDHSCNCEDCEHNGDETCEKCKLIISES